MKKVYKFLEFLAQSLRFKNAEKRLNGIKSELKRKEAESDSLIRREKTREIIEKAYRSRFKKGP